MWRPWKSGGGGRPTCFDGGFLTTAEAAEPRFQPRNRINRSEESGTVSAAAIQTGLESIQALRGLYLQSTNFQIRYNACHERGWTDSYLLTIDDVQVGYGSVMGRERADRDTVFEFFVIPSFVNAASVLFREILAASGAAYIECQSNDLLFSALLFEFARKISAEVVLFEDHHVTRHTVPGALVRHRREDDRIFEHTVEPVGDYVLAVGGEIVATGGFMLHYNVPFADLYMEVREDCRRRGLATLLLQELKKECYLAGRVPAARCNLRNLASRGALTKAGLEVCGFMLTGEVSIT